MRYDEVASALPHLTPAERAKIMERLRALQSLSPGSGSSPQAPEARPDGALGELLDVIAASVLSLSGERTSPQALSRALGGPAMRAKAEALVSGFAARHAPTRAQRRGLLAVGVDCLYRDLARGGSTVSARTLARQAHRIPGALDRAFPGYAASGLLGMVVGIVPKQEDPDGAQKEDE